MNIIENNVLIIGSGPAGYTAAIYAARANLNEPHLISGLEPGGQLTITTDVENYPGFGDVIQGPWLMEEMKKQALNVGTIFHNDIVTSVNFENKPFISKTESGKEFLSKSIIIATGAQARWLNIDSENKLKDLVYLHVLLVMVFLKIKKLLLLEVVTVLLRKHYFSLNLHQKLYLFIEEINLRAEKILQERLFKNEKIEIIWNSKVIEFIGKERSITLKQSYFRKYKKWK